MPDFYKLKQLVGGMGKLTGEPPKEVMMPPTQAPQGYEFDVPIRRDPLSLEPDEEDSLKIKAGEIALQRMMAKRGMPASLPGPKEPIFGEDLDKNKKFSSTE